MSKLFHSCAKVLLLLLLMFKYVCCDLKQYNNIHYRTRRRDIEININDQILNNQNENIINRNNLAVSSIQNSGDAARTENLDNNHGVISCKENLLDCSSRKDAKSLRRKRTALEALEEDKNIGSHLEFGSVIDYSSDVMIEYKQNDTTLNSISLTEGITMTVDFAISGNVTRDTFYIFLNSSSKDGWTHFIVEPSVIQVQEDTPNNGLPTLNHLSGSFEVHGEFLGFAKMTVYAADKNHRVLYKINEIKVNVNKKVDILEKVFMSSVVIILFIAYINMGCALDLEKIKQSVKKPISPGIGLFSQYFFMPLMSYGIGYGLFYSSPELWVGLFITGCSPGGGGSNLWTYILDGDLDLSVTMTFISTVCAFATMPLWLLTLGSTIPLYTDEISLPFANIGGLIITLVLPLAIGVIIKMYKPKVASFMIKLLKPITLLFIVTIVFVGSYINYYIFFFFTWKVVLAGICLPTLGFLCGGVLAVVTKRTWKEITAISIETGIQNIGLSIAVLKVTLAPHAPLGDIAIVVTIAVATMTPLILIIMYTGRRIYNCIYSKSDERCSLKQSNDNSQIQTQNSGNDNESFKSTKPSFNQAEQRF